MAVYLPNELETGVLTKEAMNGETTFTFFFTTNSAELGTFTFETVKENTPQGSYYQLSGSFGFSGSTGFTPRYADGNKYVGAGSKHIIKPTGSAYNDGYIWSATLRDGDSNANNVITWVTQQNVPAGGAILRATGGVKLQTA